MSRKRWAVAAAVAVVVLCTVVAGVGLFRGRDLGDLYTPPAPDAPLAQPWTPKAAPADTPSVPAKTEKPAKNSNHPPEKPPAPPATDSAAGLHAKYHWPLDFHLPLQISRGEILPEQIPAAPKEVQGPSQPTKKP